MGHTGDTDELFEILGDELGAVIGDNPRIFIWIFFPSALEDSFDIDLLHFVSDFPVDNVTAVAVEHATEIVKRPCDVHVSDVDVPMAMGPPGLSESLALLGWLSFPSLQQSGLTEDTVDAGGADRDDVGVDHHVGQPPVAVQRMIVVEVDDGVFFPRFEPMVPRNPAVMFVGLAVPVSPFVEGTLRYLHPAENLFGGRLRLVLPIAYVVDDLVASFMGNPASV